MQVDLKTPNDDSLFHHTHASYSSKVKTRTFILEEKKNYYGFLRLKLVITFFIKCFKNSLWIFSTSDLIILFKLYKLFIQSVQLRIYFILRMDCKI